jgi:hypothetical protein
MQAFDFDHLVDAITQARGALVDQADKAVKISQTEYNWLVGNYIREYEQSGTDSASGERLLENLAQRLQRLHQTGLQRIEARELCLYRELYLAYPRIRETLSAKWPSLQIRETLAPKCTAPIVPVHQLLERLSFSHFVELLKLGNPVQRALYEVQAVRGNWSVRELRLQMRRDLMPRYTRR